MRKTILFTTLLSFTLLSLHVHHNEELDNSVHSYLGTSKEVCDFCELNSDKLFIDSPENSIDIYFENISFQRYIASFITTNIFSLNNKSPPQSLIFFQ